MRFARQFFFLLWLFIKLKTWRIAIGLITVTSIVSNTFLYGAFKAVKDTQRQSSPTNQGLKIYGAKEFVEGSKVLVADPQARLSQSLQGIVASRYAGLSNWMTSCISNNECYDKYLYWLTSTLFGGEILSYIDYSPNAMQKIPINCLSTANSEFGCSYLMHLVAQSFDANASAKYVFKKVGFLSLVGPIADTDTAKSHRAAQIDLKSPTTATICSANPGTLYHMIFPLVIMFQMVLSVIGLTAYIIFCNISTISRLKKDGFLQLMFQNGLSVHAYWCALWLMTAVEMAIFGAIFALAFYLQCPGFYSAGSLFLAFLTFFLLGIFISSIGYLCASLIKSYFITLLLMLVVAVALVVLFLVNSLSNSKILRNALLIFPFSPIVEFLIEILIRQGAVKEFYLAALLLCILIPILLIPVNWYIDFLCRNGNGFCLPPSFPISSQFWTPSGKSDVQVRDEPHRPNIEPVEEGLQPLICVKDISKTYKKREYPCSSLQMTTALNGVSCTIYDGQITALIGHNGAGKTTLLKILTGDESPTTGNALIDGIKVTEPMQRQSVRDRIGICHQIDVLCNDLTVQQCIELVLVSRGFSRTERKSEVNNLLSRLDLDDKDGVDTTDLSGGQKRKLCTILALIGDPKVVFLDEPTSGVDPVSRRNLWQILQEYKHGRAIVLCTQFMDEADILADRKIFLSSGSLICAGSSLFLKHAFGCGFLLNVSLESEHSVNKLLSLIQTVCRSVQLKNQFRTEVELALPATEATNLPNIVRILENQKSLVVAFGLSQATLDDIFMRLKDVDIGQIETAFKSGQLSSFAQHNLNSNKEGQSELQNLLSAQSSHATSASGPVQFGALMKMNLTRLKRAKLKFCCRFVFPAILLLVLLGCLFLEKKIVNRPALRENITVFESIKSGVCVHESDDPVILTSSICSGLIGASDLGKGVFTILKKNQSTDLSEFLLLPDTLEKIKQVCSESCRIVYSSSWDRSAVNNNRSIQLGFYEANRFSSTIVGAYVDLYSKVAEFFGATSPLNSTFTVGVTTYKSCLYPTIGVYIFLFLYSIIPVTYISDPIEDKESKVRYHLSSMGLGVLGYWINTFVLHWCQYAVFVILSAVLHAVIVPASYGNTLFLVGICLPVLFLGCTSNQLVAYAIGSMLQKPNPILTVFYFLFVMWLSCTMALVQLDIVASIVMIWLLPPFASMALVLFGVKISLYALSYYNVTNIKDIPHLGFLFLSHPFVLQSLVASVLHIALLLLFIAALENRSEIGYFCRRVVSRKTIMHDQILNQTTDNGVKQEVKRLNKSSRSPENILEVKSLTKKYGNGVMAVRGVTFGATPGEIFGLLGPNGAGKTTTLSIVVGEEVATDGSCEIRFDDDWMSGSGSAGSGAVGYCPQHNPLFENITVMEHLEFYSTIRGVSNNLAAKQIPNLIKGLGLEEHKLKQANQLSGGNKRRLCLAISLLGNPSLVIIDEASTGVDPEAKRLIWSAIRGMTNNQRSVVVTTHSMEEVEALCNRVGIMNHGQMIALGSIQQLKSRYGNAYTLDILLSTNVLEERSIVSKKMKKLIATILSRFPKGKVVVELLTRVQFLVPQESLGSFSYALSWLTNSQQELGIQYLTLYQMSLDQVFVRLIKEQEDVTNAKGN